MPAKLKDPAAQERALLVRDAIACLGIEFPDAEEDRFTEAAMLRLAEELPNLESGQVTRLNEAACAASSKRPGVAAFRSAIRQILGRRYDLAGARKRAAAAAR